MNGPFDEENSEWEQSDNEDGVDSERKIFDDIIIDDEWIDNPDIITYFCLPNIWYIYYWVVFVSVFCYFVFQVRRFGIVVVLHF